MTWDDHDLTERFLRLRAEESHRVPALGRLLDPRARPRRPITAALAAAGLLVVAALAWVVGDFVRAPQRRTAPARREQLSLAAWVAPTDFLLATPGRELLTRTPEFGWNRGWYPLESLSPRSRGS